MNKSLAKKFLLDAVMFLFCKFGDIFAYYLYDKLINLTPDVFAILFTIIVFVKIESLQLKERD